MSVINRLRDSNAQLFVEISMMHLSRAMDLAGEEFANLFTELAHKDLKVKKDKHLVKPGIMNGAPLTQEGICTVYQLIQYIGQDFNICQENIFRKPGHHGRQEHLTSMLNNGITLDLNSQKFNVHDCCCVLKNFLGDMPEPLLASSLFRAHLKISDETEKKQNRVTAVQILLLLLPVENFMLLQNLLNLLSNVSSRHFENKMGAENLAIIFSPLLLCPRHLSPHELQPLIAKCVPVIKFMITNVSEIFHVPNELVVDIEKHLHAIESGNMEPNGPVQSSLAFCQRQPLSYTYTKKQVEGLLTDVHNMPDCEQKKIFLKRLKDQKGQLTPITPKEQRHSKHLRSFSVGESLKKILTRSGRKTKTRVERRASSCERLQVALRKNLESADTTISKSGYRNSTKL